MFDNTPWLFIIGCIIGGVLNALLLIAVKRSFSDDVTQLEQIIKTSYETRISNAETKEEVLNLSKEYSEIQNLFYEIKDH